MVNNNPKTSNIKKTTEKYRYVTMLHAKEVAGLEADIENGKQMLKNKLVIDDAQAKLLIKVATKQLAVAKAAQRLDMQENIAAYKRGEIEKFW